MVRISAERLRHDPFELSLDLVDVLAGCEAGPVADAEHVRVDRKGLLAERGVEDDVRRLPPDAGQLFKLLPGLRNLAAMIADQGF